MKTSVSPCFSPLGTFRRLTTATMITREFPRRLRNPTHCLHASKRGASSEFQSTSLSQFCYVFEHHYNALLLLGSEGGSWGTIFMISAVTNNEAIDGSISKLFSNCAIVKNALVTSSYESFTVTNSLNVFITARRRRHCSSKRTSKHNHIQWNPVNTETKGTCFTSRFIRSGI